jgi:hypothetical protein
MKMLSYPFGSHVLQMLTSRVVHNDFHQTNGIFPLFDGLCVKGIDDSYQPIATNGHLSNGVSVDVDVNHDLSVPNGHKET